MKYIIFIIFTKLVFFVNSEKNDFKFLPRLPMGEFRINYKAILKCDSMSSSNLLFDFHLSKISLNETELVGNMSFKMPLDDSLTFKVNMAVKDSIGGWKNNAYLLSFPKACSTMKRDFGEGFQKFYEAFGINNSKCPIAPGVFITKGFKLPNYVENSPDFFYGTYKCRVFFADRHNKEHGCISFVVEVRRPWEIY